MTKLSARITALEERLGQLKARQQKSDAHRRTLESRRARRDDTRRKILIGAIVLAKIEQGAFDKAVLVSWLDQGLTRADDRVLFDLPVKVAQVL